MILLTTDFYPKLKAEQNRRYEKRKAESGRFMETDEDIDAIQAMYDEIVAADYTIAMQDAEKILAAIDYAEDYKRAKDNTLYMYNQAEATIEKLKKQISMDGVNPKTHPAAAEIAALQFFQKALMPCKDPFFDAYIYICFYVEMQIHALEGLNKDTTDILLRAVEKAESWGLRKPNDWERYISDDYLLYRIKEIEKAKEKLFWFLPTSPATDLAFRALNTGGNFGLMQKRRGEISRSKQTITIQRKEKRRLLTKTGTDGSQVKVEFTDIDQLTKSNKTLKKLFVFTLIKIGEMASGGAVPKEITFPLQELVDAGLYSDTRAARAGFEDEKWELTSIKFGGSFKSGKRKISQSIVEVLITGAMLENNDCTIYPNERINWEFLAAYFTYLPRYYFSLPNRAANLLLYISYLARQNTEKIKSGGSFNISFRAIQDYLNLPDEVGCAKSTRDIKDPIIEAIEAIEEQAGRDGEFMLTPYYPEGGRIKKWLDEGYLEIRLSGRYAEGYINLAKKKQAKIADTKRKAEKRKAKAAESGE